MIPASSQGAGSDAISVEELEGELNASTSLKTGDTAELTLSLSAINATGDGFDRLLVQQPQDFGTPGSPVIVETTSGGSATLKAGTHYTLDTSDETQLRVKFNSVRATSDQGQVSYAITYKSLAPFAPSRYIFEVFARNSTNGHTVHANWADTNGTTTDNNGLFVDVAPDLSVFTSAELARNNLSDLIAETTPKEIEAGKQTVISVYVKPTVLSSANDRGVDQFLVEFPREFGKISKAIVKTSVATSTEPTALAEFVEYTPDIKEEDVVKVSMTTPITDENTLVVIEVTVAAPEIANEYEIAVFADNKAFPQPAHAFWGNLNGVEDDDGDGVVTSFGDNNTFISVHPVDLGDQLNTITNVSSLIGELTSTPNGQVGTGLTMQLAFAATLASSDQGFNQLVVALPKGFTSVKFAEPALTYDNSGTDVELHEYNDFQADLANPEALFISFTTPQTTTRTYKLNIKGILPNIPGPRNIGISVDNSATPKPVDAVPGDVIANVGENQLELRIQPAPRSNTNTGGTTEVPEFVTDLSGRISPTQVGVASTTNYSITLKAIVGSSDAGFDVIRLEQPTTFEAIKNLEISKGTIGGSLEKLLKVSHYEDPELHRDEHGINIVLTTPVSSDAEIKLEFDSQAGPEPGEEPFKVFVGKSGEPGAFAAREDLTLVNNVAGRLRVTVTPSRRSAAELAEAPQAPVSVLHAEVTPTQGVTDTLAEISVLLEAQVNLSSDSGFNQIFVRQKLKNVQNVTVSYTSANGEAKLFSSPRDYVAKVNKNNRIKIKLKKPARDVLNAVNVNAGIATIALQVGYKAKLPKRAKELGFIVKVDNSSKPNRVKAAVGDVNGDSTASLKFSVIPDLSSVNTSQILVDAPVGELSKQTVFLSTPTTLDLYVSAGVATGGVGFDEIEVIVPHEFTNLGTLKLSTASSATDSVATLLDKDLDYTLEEDTATGTVRFLLLKGASHASTAFAPVYKISIPATAPVLPDNYDFKVKLFNTSLGLSVDVAPGDAHGDAITGSLTVTAIRDTSTTGNNKRGFFGEGAVPATPIITGLTGVVRAWDGSAFADTITVSTSANYEVLFYTSPVFATTDAGFDYMNIDLPAGAGTASTFTVFMRSSDGGTKTYLEEFYDYKVDLSRTGRVIVHFQDANGVAKPVNATTMGNNTQLLIDFKLDMPRRVGVHHFDLYVDNTTNPDRYYIDSEAGNRPTTVAIASRTYTDLQGTLQNSDGTRFMTITVNSAVGATAVASTVSGEIEAVGETVLPVSSVRNFRLDFQVTTTTTFGYAEIQLPEGFASAGSFSLDQGITTMKLFDEYTLDTTHPRSIGIVFTTPQSGATYTARFALRTPGAISGVTRQDYRFGLLVDNNTPAGAHIDHVPVFSSEGNFAGNSGSGLQVRVGSDRQIGGTVTFPKALAVATKLKVQLFNAISGAEIAVVDPLPVAAPVGATTAPFSISQLTSAQVAGLDDGQYIVKISAFGYQTAELGSSSNPLAIVNGSSVTGLAVALVADDVQAYASLNPAFLKPGNSGTVLISMKVALNNSATGLVSLEMGSQAASGAQGAFGSITPASLKINGVEYAVVTTTPASSGSHFALTLPTFSLLDPNDIEVGVNMQTDAAQAGVFQLNLDFIANSTPASFRAGPKLGSENDTRVLFIVGDAPVAFSGSRTIDTVLQRSFEQQIALAGSVSSASFTQTGLPSDLGVSLNSSGLLSGSPTRVSRSGFPFTVNVEYVGSNGEVGVISGDFTLFVFKLGFALYSVEPQAIPTSGGDVVLRGIGFTSVSQVSVNGVNVGATFVDQNTIVASIGQQPEGTAEIVVFEGEGADADVTKLPNPVNPNGLVIAVAGAASFTQAAVLGDNDKGRVQDYRIIGIPAFYQGSIVDIMTAAFGSYDITLWRVFGYEKGYYELNSVAADDKRRLRPGTGFWFISRVSGDISVTGVNPDKVSSYTVALPAREWSLVTNLFNEDLVWRDVKVLAGDTSNPVETAIDSTLNTYTNQTLWGMDNTSSDATRPYKPESVMKVGTGYWVYNKTSSTVTLKLAKAESATTTANQKARRGPLYKAEEELPPEAPVAIQEATATAGSGSGGGGGCFLMRK